MYLSKCILNLKNSNARRDLADPYEMHRTLTRLAAGRPDRLLWRLETGRGSSPPFLLVQSKGEQDWAALFSSAGPDYGELFPDSPKEFRPIFKRGQKLLFRLRANPSRMSRRKRYAILKEDHQMQWLARRMALAGAAVLSAAVSRQQWLRTKKGGRGSSAAIVKLFSVQYDGFLLVEHPEIFSAALSEGIGHGKAFGLGLLSVAPG